MNIVKNGDNIVCMHKGRKYNGTVCDFVADKYKGFRFHLKDENKKFVVSEAPGDSAVLPIVFYAKDIVESNKVLNVQKPIVKTINKPIAINDKEIEKINEVDKFFKEHVTLNGEPFLLNQEQLMAVITDKTTLLTARAGSGKTRVLTAKVIYLKEKLGLNEDQILAFSFNADASNEINKRLIVDCCIDGKSQNYINKVAKTFHSFAYRKLDYGRGVIKHEKDQLIKDIVNEKMKDFECKKAIYEFFKEESARVDGKYFGENRYEYCEYIKNCDYKTLNGDRVKSKAEKYIADFLFEHGIDYYYEYSFYPSRIYLNYKDAPKELINKFDGEFRVVKETKPDFYLPDYNLVWEHWAIKGNESQKEISDFNRTFDDYARYKRNKEWKQKFWKGEFKNYILENDNNSTTIKGIKKLIETVDSKNKSREDFEHEIKELLEENGVICQKLDQNILIERAWSKVETAFTKMVAMYINKFQQNFFESEEEYVLKRRNIKDKRTEIFLDFCYDVYQEYLHILKEKELPEELKKYEQFNRDFNQIIYDMSRFIRAGELDEQLKHVQWVLIDEYQDFSKLFKYLIDSILMRNPKIKLFCVGDDWQAINRFAGSNLEYFENFGKYYKNACFLNIVKNYRSAKRLVDYANEFMVNHSFYGKGAESAKINVKSIIEKKDISVYNMGVDKDAYPNIYAQKGNNKKIQLINYLRACEQIIGRNSGKTIKILSRSKNICGIELEEFYRHLKSGCYKFLNRYDFEKRVEVKSVHRSKGEECDIVIILNVNEYSFPVYNENNTLFEIFGDSVMDYVKDEARLYYVALTRAKEKLYILYEIDKQSEFVF